MGLMDGLSRGLSAAGYAAADLFSKQALEEQRAKLEEEKALRIADALEARKAAPMQRFSGLMSAKMAEQVPQEAAPADTLTKESAQAVGLQDGIQGGPDVTGDIVERARTTLANPQATSEQKADAQGIIDQIAGQSSAQYDINQKAVEGKTRPRTQQEAIKAALSEALANDPQAYVAGRALTAADKEDLEERKMASREKIEQARIEQRDRSDDKRFEAMMARIEALGNKDGKSGDKTALIQNAEYLKSLGYSDDKIEKFIFDKKELPLEDIAAKILAGDKFGDMTPEQAAQKAIGLRNALNSATRPGKQATPSGDRPPLSSFMKTPSRESSGKIKY